MSVEENKATLRRFAEEVFTHGNLATIDEFIAPDVIDHAAPPGFPPGAEGVKQLVAMYRAAFPDLQMTIETQVGEGDLVSDRFTLRGTHQGPLFGVAPTGKKIAFSGIDHVRFAGDRMVEHWAELDLVGLLQQLGIAPFAGPLTG
jgi:predicted ester cyclase